MIWKQARDELPKEGKSVLVFRIKKKQYTVCKLEVSKKPVTRPIELLKQITGPLPDDLLFIWRHSSGNALKLDSGDYWQEFEPVTLNETFT